MGYKKDFVAGNKLLADELTDNFTELKPVNEHIDPVPAFLTCAAAGALANFQAISDGAFNITIDGVSRAITGLDLTGSDSEETIASEIQTAIRALTSSTETVEYDTDHFVLSSADETSSSAITVLSAPSSGTDISGSSYLNGLLGVVTTYDKGSLNSVVKTGDDGIIDEALLGGTLLGFSLNGYYSYQLPFYAQNATTVGGWEGFTFDYTLVQSSVVISVQNSSKSGYTKLLGKNYCYGYTFDTDLFVQFPFIIDGAPFSQNKIYMGISGSKISLTFYTGIYFSIDSASVLKAVSSYSSVEESTIISGITMSTLNIYSIKWDSSAGIAYFYVNGVLKATHSTTTPPNSVYPGYLKLDGTLGGSGDSCSFGIPTVSIKVI